MIDVSYILKYLKKIPQTILEFGSFNGDDGLKYKKAFPQCEVHSIEACPILFDKLKFLIEHNIHIHHYAITDRTGEIEFYQSRIAANKAFGPTGSVLKATDYVRNLNKHILYIKKPIKVPCITIKDFCIKYNIKQIDLIHADTQGNIIEVINGFGEFKPKMLFAEVGMHQKYHGADEFKTTQAILEKINYSLIFKKGWDALFVLKGQLT